MKSIKLDSESVHSVLSGMQDMALVPLSNKLAINKDPERYVFHWMEDEVAIFEDTHDTKHGPFVVPIKIPCPIGKVGDIIYVREKWAETSDGLDCPIIAYVAKGGYPVYVGSERGKDCLLDDCLQEWSIDNYPACGSWLPPSLMPKKYARLYLKITSIDVLKSTTDGKYCWKIGFESRTYKNYQN